MQGGESRLMSAGDMVIIPKGAHTWSEITSDTIDSIVFAERHREGVDQIDMVQGVVVS